MYCHFPWCHFDEYLLLNGLHIVFASWILFWDFGDVFC